MRLTRRPASSGVTPTGSAAEAIAGVEGIPSIADARAPSFSRGVALIMAANAAMALYQWGVILVTARLASPRDLGALTLGLAIAAPLLTLSTWGLRLVQLRDVGFEASAARYVQARVVAVAACLLAILPVTTLFDLSGGEFVIVFAVVGVRCVEAVADACWAFLLSAHAAGQLVRVLFVRASASLGVFGLTLLVTRRTAMSLVALGLVSLLLVAIVELPQLTGRERDVVGARESRRGPSALRLVALALPLGVASALTSLHVSIPRYFLQHERGIQSVAIFSAMAAVFAVVSLFTAAVGQTAIPRLARAVRSDRGDEFLRLLGTMLALGLLVGMLALVTGIVAGRSILTLLYGALFATELAAFRWLLITLALMCLTTFLQDALTVLDWKSTQVAGFGLGTVTTAILCARWIPGGGTTAAAASLCAGAVAQLLFFGAAVGLAYRRHVKRPTVPADG